MFGKCMSLPDALHARLVHAADRPRTRTSIDAAARRASARPRRSRSRAAITARVPRHRGCRRRARSPSSTGCSARAAAPDDDPEHELAIPADALDGGPHPDRDPGAARARRDRARATSEARRLDHRAAGCASTTSSASPTQPTDLGPGTYVLVQAGKRKHARGHDPLVMKPRRTVSPERKSLYTVGVIVQIVGGIVLVVGFVGFVLGGQRAVHSFGNEGSPLTGFFTFGAGILLVAVGGAMRNLAARGVAGSGVVLDPNARPATSNRGRAAAAAC
jgi:hypothetical protein